MNMATKRKKCMLAILMSVCMALVFCAGVIPRMEVMASGEMEIELCVNGGSIAGENGTFAVKNSNETVVGTVTVKVDNADYAGNSQRISVTERTKPVVITLKSAEANLQGVVRTGGNNPAVPAADVNGDTAIYTIDISDYSGNFIAFMVEFENKNSGVNPGGNPGGEPQEPGNGGGGPMNMEIADLLISDGSYEHLYNDVTAGSTLVVPDTFDFSKIKIIVKKLQPRNSNDVFEYEGNDFATGVMTDMDNGNVRDAFSFNGTYKGDNYMKFGLEFHADHPENKKGYPGFYIQEFKLVKEKFRGIKISSEHFMDLIDFGGFNEVDLAAGKGGILDVFYGDSVVTLDMDAWNSQTITDIKANGIPEKAVTINVEKKTVQFNSDFYDEIPLTVTLNDGTKSDVVIRRLGIEMHLYGSEDPQKENDERPLHGASGWGANFPDEYQNKFKLGAVFYHVPDASYNDYQLVAALVFADGTTETRIVDSYGERIPEFEMKGNTRGADYILWAGDSQEEAPVAAYVTAVPTGSLTGSDFGGCAFGAGAGVAWVPDELREE